MSRFSMLDAMDALEDAQSEAAERYADADNKHNSPQFHAKANSHTILIIDTSASMQKVDAATGEIDGKTGEIKYMSRIAALQKAVAHGFVKQQLVSGVSENDLVSVLRLQDDSQFICELESMPGMLERGLLPSSIMPKSHGNYIPALQRLHRVVQDLDRFRREHPKLANPEMNTIVLFLSDGKPSDTIQVGRNQVRSRDPVAIARVVKEIMFAIYRTLGSDERLRFHTVGLGDDDFVILRGMADALPQGVGSFHNARLSTEALLETLTAFSTTVSTTRQTSQVGGPRLLRPVTKAEQLGDEKWIRMNMYTAKGTWRVPMDWWAKIRKGQLSKKARNRLEDVGERVIAVSHVSFNQGGERNVFYLRMGDEQAEPNPTFTEVEFVPAGELVQVHGLRGAQRFSTDINGSIGVVEDMLMGARGEHKYRVNVSGTRMTVGIKNLRASSRVHWSSEEWVAKENLKIEATSEKETAFHQASLTTQATASALAEEFNGCIKALHLPQKLPEVQFVKKCFYMTVEVEGGGVDTRRHFFVEPFIDGTHRKWNTNTGKVNLTSVVESGGGGGGGSSGGGDLGGIQEDDEEEEEEEAGSPSPFSKFQPVRAPTTDDVPQAFSHWSCTKPIQGKVKALLVCDLQGVFMPESFAFNWVDPVIHSDIGGHKGFFSRTDLGADGMKEFLRTHKCNALCRQLKLPHNFDYDPEYTKQSPSKAGDDEASRNTSQFTVVQTDHLKQRKEERNVTTRQLQAAKKHGVATSQADGKVQYDHEGLRAVFGGQGASVGITTFRTRDGAGAQQPAASSSSGQAGKLPSADLSCFSHEHNGQLPRFAVGSRVECRRDNWEPGTIIKSFVTRVAGQLPIGVLGPYQVKLDDGEHVYVPLDVDSLIRRLPHDQIQRLAPPPAAAPEKTEVMSPAPPEAPSLRGGAKGKLEAEQKQKQQERQDERKKQECLDATREMHPGWVTKASMKAMPGLPANWVALSEQGVHGRVPSWSDGLVYYNFLEKTWADTRPADEWQAVAPRRPKQSGKQPGSAAAPPYLRLKMPRSTRPRQVLQFEYESFRCTFEVPKAYDGREEVVLVPPRNWPHGDSLVEHWTLKLDA